MQSSPSILVLRRMSGPLQIEMGSPNTMPGFNVIPYIVPEPALRIYLDGKKIGTITIAEHSWMEGWSNAGEKSSPFAIQAGHHNLFLSEDWLKSPKMLFFKLSGLKSPTLPFDVAPGETVTLYCQYAWKERVIRLSRDIILP